MTEDLEIAVRSGDLVHVTTGPAMTAHYISRPQWDVSSLDYVDRCELSAKLRALADIIDPGTYTEYLERLREQLSAESVTRR